MPRVGIIANPQSGKDIRRLVALAGSFSNHEKVLILRRVLAGLAAAGAEEAVVFDDLGGLGAAAAEGLGEMAPAVRLKARLVRPAAGGDSGDSTAAAAGMRRMGVACIVVIGGDGTCRAVAKGCGRTPLVPLSTGTNNAFPRRWEGTVAGLGAGLYARRPRRYARLVRPSKRLRVDLDGAREMALVDVAVVRGSFSGARAVWDIGRVEALALTRCEPGGLGLSAIGASVDPVLPAEPEGLWMEFGGGRGGRVVLSPIGPGLVVPARVRHFRRIGFGECVAFEAAGERVLAFDGEREYALPAGGRFSLMLEEKGPRVIDIPAVLELAARRGDLAPSARNGAPRRRAGS